MRQVRGVMAVGLSVMVLALAGCARGISVRTIEIERVDQDLTQGNRGYLIGTPPPPPERSATRQILEIEIPYGSTQQRAPASGAPTTPVTGVSAPPAAPPVQTTDQGWSK